MAVATPVTTTPSLLVSNFNALTSPSNLIAVATPAIFTLSNSVCPSISTLELISSAPVNVERPLTLKFLKTFKSSLAVTIPVSYTHLTLPTIYSV